jgi:hypothetical protein
MERIAMISSIQDMIVVRACSCSRDFQPPSLLPDNFFISLHFTPQPTTSLFAVVSTAFRLLQRECGAFPRLYDLIELKDDAKTASKDHH